MFSLRSARGRAILAGLVLVVLLAGVATLAVWRAHNDHQQHNRLEHTSAAATALEHAQAEFWRAQATLSTLVFLSDPSFADDYHATVALLEQDLSQARADALAAGEADHVAVLDDLTERIGQFNEQANLALPLLLEADLEARAQLAAATAPAMVSEAKAIVADLQTLVEAHASHAAAATAAADRAANTTLWLLIGFSTVAFLAAAGTVSMVIVSVVRPLAALRASARAITSGDLEARAKVSGPEEVASLAHDFNEMTETLAAKTQEYIDTANLTGVMLLKVGKDGRCIFLNDATSEFLGRPKEEILGAQITDYLHPEDTAAATQTLREMVKSKEPMLGAVSRYVTPLGTRIAEWNAYPLFDEQGQYAGLQATGRDITERKQAEDALRESESKYRTLLENLPQKIFSKDKNSVYISCNDNYARDLNIKPADIIGQPQATIHPPQKAEHYVQMFKRHMEQQGFVEDEAEVITKSGKTKPVLITASVASVRGTPIIQGAFRDITERKRLEEERERLHAELEIRAITDSLTGLYNHAHFYQRLDEEIDRSKRYKRRFAVVMMDVDAFKHYNDSRGHQAGDDALRLLAHCIRTGIRGSDIAFRYGGDEFATILLNADSPRAQTLVNRINRRIATSLKDLDDPAAAWLGLSAGVASFPQDGITPDDLVRVADAALYDAKRVTQARSPIEKAQAAWPLATARAAGRRKD